MVKIYLIATEPSGDFIGACLIKKLKRITKNRVIFYGIGGNKMIKEGLNKTLFPINKLSLFGFFEILPKLFKIRELFIKTEKNILKINPDILITIDSPDFNFRILKRIYKNSLNIRKVHYVAPTVWAWRKNRAKFISKYTDHLLTILPFEKKYFIKYGLKTTFVGHPVFDIKALKKNETTNVKKKYKVRNNQIILSILPGSRGSEIKRTMPVLIKSIKRLKLIIDKDIHVFFYILPHLKKYLKKIDLNFNYSLIQEEDKYAAFKISNVAICASGTVALELSYFNIPTIVIYKLNFFSYFIAKLFVKINYANILNILENKYIIPEFLQFECQPKKIVKELFKLLKDKNYSMKQIKEANKSLIKLKLKNRKPSLVAANEIINETKNLSLE
jgi:lipid-A-disaccharide synthase